MAVSLIGFASLAGCDRGTPATAKQAREVMGTLAELTAIAPDAAVARSAVEAAYGRLDDINRLMSDYRDDSEIGRFNLQPENQPVPVSPDTFNVLQQALAASKTSGGAFDITCRPLVSLWKEAGKNDCLPDQAAIDATLAKVGWTRLHLDPQAHTVSKMVAGMQIDVGGIAKGYALDAAAQAMKAAGASGGLVDVGGDIVAFGGQTDGSPWRIGVQHPFQDGLLMKIALTHGAVATSGNQQRFSVIGGKRYSHIIDPRTGRPAEQAPSVTVIASDGMTADAWATAFSVLSVEEGKKKASELQGIEVMWAWGQADRPQIAQTPGFARYLIR
jgi:FAD:protein FMN transferase